MFHGADTGQLQDFAQRLAESSGRTSELLDEATTAVLSAPWEGADAERFRQEFFGSVTHGWRQLIDRLHLSEDEIRAHADEQDQASDAGDRRSPGADGGEDAAPAAREDRHERGAADVPVTAEADRGDGTDPQPPNPDGTIDGPDPYPGIGLGPGVPGTSAETPEPPAWEPADSGSGEWDSREPTDEDRENLDLAEDMVLGGRFTGKGAASDNLQHYLDTTGEDKSIDVEDMLEEVPAFTTAVDEQRSAIGQEAIAQAQESGATGPVTFPVNTDWEGGEASSAESEKYYYATGSFDYNQTGTVTAHPPAEPGGEWTYEVDTAVNVRDRYNWDTGKGVHIDVPDWVPGYPDEIHVSDTQMQGLHQSGLAREYNIVGSSEK
jgi:uncharacterized protein YukE